MSPAYTYKMSPLVSTYQIIDGDTLKDVWIDMGFHAWHKTDLRLWNIDAHEIRTLNLEEKAKGIKAKEVLDDIFMKEKNLIVKVHGKDNFGRWLGQIFIVTEFDGPIDLGKWLIKEHPELFKEYKK